MEEIKRKRGRPKTGRAMQNRLDMMMSEDMAGRLRNLSKITGMTQADIIREAFNRYESFGLIRRSPEETEEHYDDFYDDFDEDFE